MALPGLIVGIGPPSLKAVIVYRVRPELPNVALSVCKLVALHKVRNSKSSQIQCFLCPPVVCHACTHAGNKASMTMTLARGRLAVSNSHPSRRSAMFWSHHVQAPLACHIFIPHLSTPGSMLGETLLLWQFFATKPRLPGTGTRGGYPNPGIHPGTRLRVLVGFFQAWAWGRALSLP
jgi:hypothetical protein